MNRVFACLLLAATLAAAESTTKWGTPSNDNVSVLTDANFQDFIYSHKYVMVMFTSPDCPHCKSAHPEYAYMAKKYLQDETAEAVIAELDVIANPKTALKYQVTGYPSFKFFFHAIPIDYNMARAERYMNLWVQARCKDKATELTSLEQFGKLKTTRMATVLYMGKKNKRLLTSFQALAATYIKDKFFYTYLDEVKDEENIGESFGLILIRGFDDGNKVLSSEDLTYETMQKFYSSLRLPLVPELVSETGSLVFGKDKVAVLMFADRDDTPEFEVFQKVGRAKKHNINFARANFTSNLGKKMAELTGVTSEQQHQVRLLKFDQGHLRKYRLDTVTEESLGKFVDDFVAGKLQTYLKSDPPAPKAQPGSVQTVVGQDFEKLVFESPANVFLMIHAHDCKHCDEVTPIWAKLASKTKDVPNLVIASMNGVTNEHPTLEVAHYPTFKLYPRKSKGSPVEFKGKRSLKEFAEFLEHHLGSDWKSVIQIEDDSL